MNVAANGKILVTATKALSIKWAETRESWRDAKSQEFEAHYLQNLLASVDRISPVFEDLEKLLTKVRNDCE